MIHSEFDSTSGVFTIPVTLKNGGLANRILVKPKANDVEVLENGLQLPAGSKLICNSVAFLLIGYMCVPYHLQWLLVKMVD
jgi:hypothetical protein